MGRALSLPRNSQGNVLIALATVFAITEDAREAPLTLELSVKRCLSNMAAVLALTGCVTVTTTDGDMFSINSSEFRAYVERTFREQNRWATELLYAQERAEGERYESLIRAEDSLLAACAGLNELAVAHRDGRSLGRFREASLARTAPECEVSTRGAREIISSRNAH